MGVLLLLGLFIYTSGDDYLLIQVLFATSIVLPLFIATKGIEFIIDQQPAKAFLTILLLSLVSMLSIIFIFI
jgi:hypothetical protein